MIDLGLAASLAITAAAVWWAARRWRRSPLLDALVTAILVGAGVARVVHLAVEHPAGLLSPMELISLRSGAAWWPGVAAGLGWWWLRSGSAPVAARSAALAATVPLALVAHGTLAATCVVRDGCPGPPSAIGLVPDGLTTRVLPLGLLTGLVLLAVAVGLERWALAPPAPPTVVLAVAGVAVASTRLVTTLAAPALGARGPSLAVDGAVLVAAVLVGLTGLRRRVASPT